MEWGKGIAALAALLLASPTVPAAVLDQLWTVHTVDTYPPAITSAPNGGVYVTSTNSGGDRASLTRYSSTGAQDWRLTIGTNSTRGSNVVSDSSGNVYIAGQCYYAQDGSYAGASDVFVRKYTSSGGLVWGKQYGTAEFDWPVGAVLAPDSSIYVTSGGWTANYGVPPPGSYTTTRRYGADGTPGWIAPINTLDGTYPGGSAPWSSGTVLASTGEIYSIFTNYGLTAPNNIYAKTYLSKLTSAGVPQWAKPLTHTGDTFGADVDSFDNVYIAGGNLTKYDSAGNQLWHTPDSSLYSLHDVFINSNGNIYASGYLWDGAKHIGLVREYSPAGTVLWSKTITAGTDALWFYSLTQSGNNLIVAGQTVTGGTWSGNQIVAIVIPEPGSLALVSLGLLGLLRRRRASSGVLPPALRRS